MDVAESTRSAKNQQHPKKKGTTSDTKLKWIQDFEDEKDDEDFQNDFGDGLQGIGGMLKTRIETCSKLAKEQSVPFDEAVAKLGCKSRTDRRSESEERIGQFGQVNRKGLNRGSLSLRSRGFCFSTHSLVQ